MREQSLIRLVNKHTCIAKSSLIRAAPIDTRLKPSTSAYRYMAFSLTTTIISTPSINRGFYAPRPPECLLPKRPPKLRSSLCSSSKKQCVSIRVLNSTLCTVPKHVNRSVRPQVTLKLDSGTSPFCIKNWGRLHR